MGIGDVTEDDNLALGVDGPADSAVVGEGDVDCVYGCHVLVVAVQYKREREGRMFRE